MSDLSYTEAMQRLESILSQLEEGNKTVDELSALVLEASELIKLCRTKLRTTEESIQIAFEGI